MSNQLGLCFVLCLTLVLLGCPGQKPEASTPKATAPASTASGHHHHHTAPHGGTLVVLGDEFAHLEFLLETESGTLTVYLLDSEAENAIRLPGGVLELELEGKVKLSLQPVADELTGETSQDTSTFRCQNEVLKGVKAFGAVLASIEIKGQTFRDVRFRFPEGNESHHDHH